MFDSSYSDCGLHPLFFSAAAAATTTAVAYPAPPHGLPRSYLQRRSIAHSLPLHHHALNSNASSMRRVLSAGDLQVAQVDRFLLTCLPNSHFESSLAFKIESFFVAPWTLSQGMVSCAANANHRVVGRYSAEERKERIERYRSKRNRRNFRRKITYACRKTLADSRPRVRGRFKRNGEMETEAEAANGNSFEFYSYDDAEQKQSKSRKVEVDWRSQLQAALAAEDQTESCYDEELLAGFADAFSINIFS